MPRSGIYKRIAICMLAGLAVGVLISEVSYYFLGTGETRRPQVIRINIPAGTALRVSQGKSDPSLPSSMTFVVGDTLLVNNQDTAVHQLGPLSVPPGASSTMKLEAAQDYAAACSFQPTKYIGLRIQSPLTLGTRLAGILEAGIPLGFLIALYSLFAIPVNRGAAA